MNADLGIIASRAQRWVWVTLLCCNGVLAAPSADGASGDSMLQRVAAVSAERWSARSAEARHLEDGGALSGLSIVASPPEGLPGTPGAQRVRHSLSVRSETPQRMLRAIGVDATDCSTRFRMPTKLRQGSGGVDVTVRAQVGLACSF